MTDTLLLNRWIDFYLSQNLRPKILSPNSKITTTEFKNTNEEYYHPDNLKQIASKYPNANLAIDLHDYLTLDFDLKAFDSEDHLNDSVLEVLTLIGMNSYKAWIQKTANGGIHILIKNDTEHKYSPTSKCLLNNLVDLKAGLNSYIVVQPSIIDGKTYEWKNPKLLKEQPLKLSECSKEFLDAIRHRIKLPEGPKQKVDTQKIKTNNEDQIFSQEIDEGSRNDTLTQKAGFLRRYGGSKEWILDCMVSFNNLNCNPPLPEQELIKLVDSISKYEPESEFLQKVIGGEISEEINRKKQFQELQFENASIINRRYKEEEIQNPVSIRKIMERMEKDKPIESTNITKEKLIQAFLKPNNYLPTGIDPIDYALGGGKRYGELTAWTAEKKTGKNTFWAWMQYEWIKKKIPQFFFSREVDFLTDTILNLQSLEHGENFFSKEQNDISLERAHKLAEQSMEWLKLINSTSEMGPIILDKMLKIIQDQNKLGVKHFWIDHLHHLVLDSEDYKKISVYIRELKSITSELDIHVDLIIQPSRPNNRKDDVTAESARGGAVVPQVVNNLFTLNRVKIEDEASKELLITNVTKVKLELRRFRHKNNHNDPMFFEYNPDNLSFKYNPDYDPKREPNKSGYPNSVHPPIESRL